MEQKLRDSIDETLAPRLQDFDAYMVASASVPFVAERADLLYVKDQYGDQKLDFSNPLQIVGHGNSVVGVRVREQLNHHGYLGPQGQFVQRWPTEYAKMLCESLPREDGKQQQILFLNDGVLARNQAMSLALHATGRSGWCSIARVPLADYHDRDLLPRAAAYDPLLVDRDGKTANPEVIQEYADNARQVGALVLVDERETGFGRCGQEFWGQHRFGIEADITVIGGPAGGGFPFGAVVASQDVWEAFEANGAQLDLDSTAGHPVICAAGAETFLRVNEGVLAHVDDAGQGLFDALDTISKQFPSVITGVHGVGLLQTLIFPSTSMAYAFRRACLDHGLLLARPDGHRIRLTPPLIISEMEAKRGADMMAAACIDLEE